MPFGLFGHVALHPLMGKLNGSIHAGLFDTLSDPGGDVSAA
jgi:hypothetical protein